MNPAKLKVKKGKSQQEKQVERKKKISPLLIIGGVIFVGLAGILFFNSGGSKEIAHSLISAPLQGESSSQTLQPPVVNGKKRLTFATFPLTAENDLSVLYGGSEYSNQGDLYEWEINGAVISGEQSPSLKKGRFKRGDSIRVKLQLNGVSETVVSDSAIVENSPPRILSIKIEPFPPTKRDTLTAKIEAADADGDPITYSYQWLREDGTVAGTEASLQGSLFNKKEKIILEVTPFDGLVQGNVYKTAVVMANAFPKITSIPASYSGNDFQYQVTAEDPDKDPVTFALLKGPAGMTIDPKKGLIQWAFTEKDAGIHPIEIEVSDPEGAGDIQSFQLPLSFTTTAVASTTANDIKVEK